MPEIFHTPNKPTNEEARSEYIIFDLCFIIATGGYILSSFNLYKAIPLMIFLLVLDYFIIGFIIKLINKKKNITIKGDN